MIRKDFPAVGEHYFEQQLENGLLVRVIEKPGFAKRYAFLATNFGSIDTSFTAQGKAHRVPDGVAHYLEHKMFDLPAGNAMDRFAQTGCGNNAFTSYAMTVYYIECTDRFEENLKTLLEMVMTPYFTPESVEKERGIIAQEIRMYDDSADNAVYENLFSAVFRHHPVRRSIAGTVESITDITPEILYDCYRAFYAPENMMLCVMGDVDAAQVIAQASAQTPHTVPAQLPVRDYGPDEALSVVQPRIEAQMEVSMPSFSIGFKCKSAPYGPERMRRELIGDFAAELLAGESTALYARLYDEGLIDSDFSIGYEQIKDAALLVASGDSDDPDAVYAALLEQAERIAQEGVDRAHLARLNKSELGRRLRGLDGFEGTCYRMCASYFDGAEYFDYPSVIEAITAEDVELFLRETVKPSQAAISIIYPKEKKEECICF